MELTPEERKRIYEEEKVRLEAPSVTPPPKKRSVALMIILVIVVVFIVLLIGGKLAEQTETTSTSASSSATSGERTLRGTYWCGVSFDDAGQIGIAVHDGDTAALAGLLARGKAFQVEGGTRVRAGEGNDMGISFAHVESGFSGWERLLHLNTRVAMKYTSEGRAARNNADRAGATDQPGGRT